VVLRLLLAMLLVAPWVGCKAQEASVNTAATIESTAVPAADNSSVLGTEVDAETGKILSSSTWSRMTPIQLATPRA